MILSFMILSGNNWLAVRLLPSQPPAYPKYTSASLPFLTCIGDEDSGGKEGGMGEDGGEGGEVSGGVGGGGMHGILYLIKLISLLGETFASSSLFPRGGAIKGLVSSFELPSFL